MPLMLTSRGTGCEAKWELLTRVFQDNFAVGRKMFSGYKGDYKREHSNGKMNYLKHFLVISGLRNSFISVVLNCEYWSGYVVPES